MTGDVDDRIAMLEPGLSGAVARKHGVDNRSEIIEQSVGDVVRKGQVLCIIEAMKLMNEIDSEYDGEITSIYIENGQAVQYGERLFSIKPSN